MNLLFFLVNAEFVFYKIKLEQACCPDISFLRILHYLSRSLLLLTEQKVPRSYFSAEPSSEFSSSQEI